MWQHYKDFNSFEPDSMKNLFGQVARDMQSFGVKFSFVSTYHETIFLKIVTRKNGDHALQFSPIINHSDRTTRNQKSNKLESLSVRLCLLYILALVSDEDESFWSFDPKNIDKAHWTRNNSDVPADLVGEEATPQNDTRGLKKFPVREGMRRKTSDHTAEIGRRLEEARQEAFRKQRTQEEMGMSTGASISRHLPIRRRAKHMTTVDDDDSEEQ